MTRSDVEIRADNPLPDRVILGDRDTAVHWLRSAFHTHRERVASLLVENRGLRDVLLPLCPDPLSVELARTLRVCRVCRGTTEGVVRLTFNHGDEYAHTDCLGEVP